MVFLPGTWARENRPGSSVRQSLVPQAAANGNSAGSPGGRAPPAAKELHFRATSHNNVARIRWAADSPYNAGLT